MRRRDGGNFELYMSQIIFDGQYQKRFFPFVLVRDGTMSATVLIHARHLPPLLRTAGQGSIFNNLLADDPKSQDFQLVFLSRGTTLTTALQKAKDLADAAHGVVRKASADNPRFAIHMKDGEPMMKLVEELGLTEEMKCGRHKLTGVSAEVEPLGVTAMMAQISWEIAQVIYLDEDHAIIETSIAPTLNRIACRRNEGQMVVMHIRAVNSVAIKAFREAQIPFRTTDPEDDNKVISDDIRRVEWEHEDAQIEMARAAAQASRTQVSKDAKASAEAVAKSSCQKREHAMSQALPKKQGRIGDATFLPMGEFIPSMWSNCENFHILCMLQLRGVANPREMQVVHQVSC